MQFWPLDTKVYKNMVDVKYVAIFWCVVFVFYGGIYLIKINSTFTDFVWFVPYIIAGLLNEIGIPYLLHSSTPHYTFCGLGFHRPSVLGYAVIILLTSSLFWLCEILYKTIKAAWL
jgi:hypothetical protein